MKKVLLPLFILGCALRLHAATYYIDSTATSGTQSGTSWANAWLNVNSIPGTLSAGDVINISGGPVTGSGQTYSNYQFPVISGGTSGNPITIQVGQDSSHGGIVTFARGTLPSNYQWMSGGLGTYSWFTFNGNYQGAPHFVLASDWAQATYIDSAATGVVWRYIVSHAGQWRQPSTSKLEFDHIYAGPDPINMNRLFQGMGGLGATDYNNSFHNCNLYTYYIHGLDTQMSNGDDFCGDTYNVTFKNNNRIAVYATQLHTTSSFTQPAIDGTVSVTFSATPDFAVNMRISNVDSSGVTNMYVVTNISGTTVTLKNPNDAQYQNTPPGRTVNTGVGVTLGLSNHQDGVQADSYVWIQGDYIENVANYGFYGEWFGSGGHTRVLNNIFNITDATLTAQPTAGIAIGSSGAGSYTFSDIIIANNLAINISIGISLGGGTENNNVPNACSGCSFVNNITWNCGLGVEMLGTKSSFTSLCNKNNSGWDTGVDRANPNSADSDTQNPANTNAPTWVNAVGPFPYCDFHLASTDTGATANGSNALASIFNVDKDGKTRPSGAWALGPFEPSASAPATPGTLSTTGYSTPNTPATLSTVKQ